MMLINISRIDSDRSLYDYANAWSNHGGKTDYLNASLEEVTVDGKEAFVKSMKEKNPELPQMIGFPLIKTFINFNRPFVVEITTGIDLSRSEKIDTEKVFNSLTQLNNSILYTFHFIR